MNDEIEINHCTGCGRPIHYEATAQQGLRRIHADTGEFLCPDDPKPDLSPTKRTL